jgi:hypothetical protein
MKPSAQQTPMFTTAASGPYERTNAHTWTKFRNDAAVPLPRTPDALGWCLLQRRVLAEWMSGRAWACASSDKPEKLLRFNSAQNCLLSECALKVFSRRNPSKLALSRGFRQSAISLWAHIAAAVLRDLNSQQWSRGSKMLGAGESGHRWLTAAGASRWRFPNTRACARLV